MVSELTAVFEVREWLRRTLIWTTHLGLFFISGIVAFLLRFDFSIPAEEWLHLWLGLAIWTVVKSAAFRWLELDRGWWRFVSINDVMRIGFGNLVGSAAGFLLILALSARGFPRSVYLLDLVICFLATSSVRVVVRILKENYHQGSSECEKRTLIYGAGAAGISLLREIRNNVRLPYAVCGFVDDDPRKAGLVIQGTRVLGPGADLARIGAKHRIELVLIAFSTARSSEMTRILHLCHDAGTTYKIIPGFGEVIEASGVAKHIRDVSVEDLLGRKPVRLEEGLIRAALENRVALVTGAGGSIGSELCRQIARFHPAGIVGFEIAESPLFEIDREMRQAFPAIPFHPEIGSVQNRARLEEVFRRYSPAVVYHAAAYKHVPMMESHVFEAIENNVFGTYNVASAGSEWGVEDFVLISSDKAVRPANIMGATKRVAELILHALQNGRTKYVAVRFGNVLGSQGSVVPIFKTQIAAGGPVTVTHPEMRRFFMTIPEACQLVLQAAAIGEGGQICVLDMGEPVKILDLARNLILLSGLRPGSDIQIEFTGLRPGEKLFEELSSILEDTSPSSHEKVRIYMGNGILACDMQAWLAELHEICETRDLGRLVLGLKQLLHDYNPSADLLKRLIQAPAPAFAAVGR